MLIAVEASHSQIFAAVASAIHTGFAMLDCSRKFCSFGAEPSIAIATQKPLLLREFMPDTFRSFPKAHETRLEQAA